MRQIDSCPTEWISVSLLCPGRSLAQSFFQMPQTSILLGLWPPHCKNKMLAFPSTPILLFQEKTRGWQLGGYHLQGHSLFLSQWAPAWQQKITFLGHQPPSVVPSPCTNKKESRTSRMYNQYLLSCKSQRTSISSTIPDSSQSGMS